MTTKVQSLWVQRSDLTKTKLVTQEVQIDEGALLIRIDRFALTSNNITYAIAPEQMGYWNFFPADEGWGRVPVWGYGEVVASRHAQIAVGRRVYGYFPMSSHLTVKPGKIGRSGFSDMAPHRQPMSPIYNAYGFVEADPAYVPAREGLVSLLRPLFTTSWLLDVLHRENDCFGADTAVVTSASSKTSLGLAFMLAQQGGPRVVGLTSAANRAFTLSTGVYYSVLSYDEAASIDGTGAAIIDMAGDTRVLRALHEGLGPRLRNSCRVGLTHWQNTAAKIEGLPGPRPEFFFAPSFAQEKIAEWGIDGFYSRLGAASAAFYDKAASWIEIDAQSGPDALMRCYLEMLQGRVDPARGHVLSLN